MKKLFLIAIIAISFTGCKKEKSDIPQAELKPAENAVSVEELAAQSMSKKTDWSSDIQLYLDSILICSNSAPTQTKYVFRAERLETPALMLILLKTEDDRVFACSLNPGGDTPHYKEIGLKTDEKSPRFYPAALPKPDSCLNNTRVLDKSGHTAGWLSKITC